jgi:hypothetical protein
MGARVVFCDIRVPRNILGPLPGPVRTFGGKTVNVKRLLTVLFWLFVVLWIALLLVLILGTKIVR